MILGANNGLEKIREYAREDAIVNQKDSLQTSKKDSLKITKKGLSEKEKIELDKKLSSSFIPKETRKKIIEELEKDSINSENIKVDDTNDLNISIAGDTRLDVFSKFYKTHEKMPVDEALDSLGYEHTFWNRFWYDKGKSLNNLVKTKEGRNQFLNQAFSYGSVALFIFLPFFTLFLKFFYIRRRFTYVDHLVFVFHCQTVFFMLLSVFFIINMITNNGQFGIFTILFLLYLFIAMKNFYGQGYLKTILKFLLVNTTYLFISTIGIIIVLILSFALI